jgi:N6-adenosine-specific RNA methylase IME4
VQFTWDKVSANGSIDLDASGETFYNTIQHVFRRRLKGNPERSVLSILFTTEKGSEEAIMLSVSLDESTLESDWESVVDWMKDNRRTKPPHLYAIVELENG